MGLPGDLHSFAKEQGVSNAKLMGACGNGWPVNAVAKVIGSMGLAMGWKKCESWCDGMKQMVSFMAIFH